MMCRFLLLGSCFLGCIVSSGPLRAQAIGSGLIASDAARRYGLQRAWFTQVRVDPARGKTEHFRLHVSPTKAQKVFEVVTDRGDRYAFSERGLDSFGRPLGVEGARKQAEQRLLQIKTGGGDGRIDEKLIPDITLYVTTNMGLVHALDAETGRTRWTAEVGNRNYLMSAPMASDKYVALVNGTTIFVLSADDGKLLWNHRAQRVPSVGPAVFKDFVFVPTLAGIIEAYTVRSDAHWWPDVYRANGAIAHPPTVAGNRIIWTTRKGDVTAITAGQPGIRFRLRMKDAIAGPVTYAPPKQLFAVTESGYLYSFDVTDGSLMWQFGTGEETRQPAIVVGKTVFLISRWAGMYAVDVSTGAPRWWAKQARQFIAATRNRVYIATNNGQTNVLDLQSGNLIATIPTRLTDQIFINSQTDRIYIGSQSGVLQCLHELGADWPVIHVPGAVETETSAKPPKADAKPADTKSGPVDPFGSGLKEEAPPANPFGPGAAPAKGSKDKKKEDGGNPFG